MEIIHLSLLKLYIADYLGKCYFPSNISTQENKIDKLVTYLMLCKGISWRTKYCYRDVPPNNLITTTGVTWNDDFEPKSMSKANHGLGRTKKLTFISSNYF